MGNDRLSWSTAATVWAALTASACSGWIEGDMLGSVAENPPIDATSSQGTPSASATPGASGSTGTTPAGPEAPLTPGLVTCTGSSGDGAAPRRLYRLSATQFKNSVAVLLTGRPKVPRPSLAPPLDAPGLFEEKSTERFSTYAGLASVIDLDASTSQDVAALAADRLVAQLMKEPASCLLTAGAGFSACLKRIVEDRGPLLFRRPLTPEEVNGYVALGAANVATLGPAEAAAGVIQVLIVSPHSLFRVEVGEGTAGADGMVKLSPFEVASALSLALTDFPPDEELWAAAQARTLEAPDQLRKQVERLIGNLGENAKLRRFVREYFNYGEAHTTPKDPKLFPFHDGEALEDDTDALVVDLLTNNGRKDFLTTLLTTPATYARARTAPSYGLPKITATTPTRMMSPAGQRSGLLTQPSFLVAFSETEENQPVQRGRIVRESLLCGTVPPLPIDSVPPLPDLGPTATLRERLASHVTNPACQVCHSLMDPLGLGFEGFDHVGRVRTSDLGNKPVDGRGVLSGAGAVDGPFNGAVELAGKLAASPVVQQCFTRHVFRYLLGRGDTGADACAVSAVDRAFAQEGDLVALVTSIAASKPFRYRRVTP